MSRIREVERHHEVGEIVERRSKLPMVVEVTCETLDAIGLNLNPVAFGEMKRVREMHGAMEGFPSIYWWDVKSPQTIELWPKPLPGVIVRIVSEGE